IVVDGKVEVGKIAGNLFCGKGQVVGEDQSARVRHAREKKNYWGHITEVYSVMGDTRVDVMIDRKGIEHDN
ncbi:hypothetical protein LCGC14_2891920, partial [marine sediment metagenome]